MQKTTREGLWGFGLLIMLGLILSVYLVTSTLQTIILKQGKITVKGYAERKIDSNFTTWQGKLNVRSDTLSKAYEQLKHQLDSVKTYLNKQGIDSKELSIAPVYTSILYKSDRNGHSTHDVEGYILSCDLTISSNQVELVTQVSEQVTELIQEGIELYSYKPQYFYTKIDELKIDLLGEAAKDAQARASQLASNSGSHVGLLRSATQGVFQITPAYSTSISDYGENDTSTIQKSIKAVVTMEYGIH